MKVMLVHAYFIARDPGEQKVMKPYPPLGILYLTAWLKQHGFDVCVFDGTFRQPEDFAREFAAYEPDVVGFYANMITRRHVLELRSSIGSDVRAVVGGPDPPHYAEEYLARGFEAVIIGEGEHTFLQLLRNMDSPSNWHSIPGLCFKDHGTTIRTASIANKQPLDDFPFPDRSAIHLDTYLDCWEKHHGMRPVSLITSRGCPYRCTWCSHNVYGYSLRKRSVENVVAELESLHEAYRFDHYWYADDVFNIQPKWLKQLHGELQQDTRLIKPFECILRANSCGEEQVATLQALKASRVWLGAESGSQRLLDLMKRAVDREKLIQAMQRLRKANIQTGMFFMWGFLDETLEDIVHTVDLVKRCEPDIALTTVAYPIKGTVFYNQLSERGLLGNLPPFETSSDRDVPISGRPDRDVYQLADRWLHAVLSESRARRGNFKDRLKVPVHVGRQWLLGRQLEKRYPRSVATTFASGHASLGS